MFYKAGLLVLLLAVFLAVDIQARLPLDYRNHKEHARALLSKYAKRENDLAKLRGKSTGYDDDFKRAAPAGCETCCSAWWCRMVNEDACLCSH